MSFPRTRESHVVTIGSARQSVLLRGRQGEDSIDLTSTLENKFQTCQFFLFTFWWTFAEMSIRHDLALKTQ